VIVVADASALVAELLAREDESWSPALHHAEVMIRR
jgi:hypothetical protein